jgi:hypothetical protein
MLEITVKSQRVFHDLPSWRRGAVPGLACGLLSKTGAEPVRRLASVIFASKRLFEAGRRNGRNVSADRLRRQALTTIMLCDVEGAGEAKTCL